MKDTFASRLSLVTQVYFGKAGIKKREKNLWGDRNPATSREFLHPVPRNGFVEGEYVAVLFNHPLNCSIIPSPLAFQLILDKLEKQAPTYASLPGGVLFLHLNQPVDPGRQALLHYSPPAKQPLQDEDGLIVETFMLKLNNLGENAAAGDECISWSSTKKIDVKETGDGSLKVSWEPANRNVVFYRLMVFVDGELGDIYEVPETFIILGERETGAVYEFLVVGIDKEGRGVRGAYARWQSAT